MKKLIVLGLMSAITNCMEINAMWSAINPSGFVKETPRIDVDENPFRVPSHFEVKREQFAYTNVFASHKDNDGNPVNEIAAVYAFHQEEEEQKSPMQLAKVRGLPIFLIAQSKKMFESKQILWEKIPRLVSVSIPDDLEHLPDKTFKTSLQDIGHDREFDWVFRPSFCKSIIPLPVRGSGFFSDSGFREIHNPDSLEVTGVACCKGCRLLSRVTFGENSSLKYICKEAFYSTGLREIHIPDNVEEIGSGCFAWCESLSRVTFGENSSLRYIRQDAFYWTGLREIHILDSIEELGGSCFAWCKSLSCVIFGENSSLKRIENRAFASTGLREIHIPDNVEELGSGCFAWCESLSSVTFGPSSSLKHIGAEAFDSCAICEICIPRSVEVLSTRCFAGCKYLSTVTFEESPSLKRIERDAFSALAAYLTEKRRYVLSTKKRIYPRSYRSIISGQSIRRGIKFCCPIMLRYLIERECRKDEWFTSEVVTFNLF